MSYDAKKLTKRYNKILASKKNPFFNPDFSMEHFGNLLGVNRTYVSQFVNNELGTSFHHLVRKIRLERVEQILNEHPELKLNEVLSECGFANDTSFRRAFKDKYGCLPSHMRRDLREAAQAKAETEE